MEASMQDNLETFREKLCCATERISNEYFMLPVADEKGGVSIIQYRERVYAYELYHKLRSIWPDWGYSLDGEVDKTRHPIVRGPKLDNAKPDLLVHVPGEMDHNLAVVEVKASHSLGAKDFIRDLEKLTAFRNLPHGPYAGAFMLVFGENIDRVRQHARECGASVDLSLIELCHHSAAGEPAKFVLWS